MPTHRMMVPVLLCFDVHHDEGATGEQIRALALGILKSNLGDVGDEDNNLVLNIADANGIDVDAAIYPSDLDWCKTLEHLDDEITVPSEEDCDCADRSWYGPEHDSACPCSGPRDGGFSL